MKCVVKNNSSMDMGPLLPLLKSLLPYSREKLGFNRPPSLFFASDAENASKPLGKTAFYDPEGVSITIFVDGRHPKDILRSISHELVHHMQHERGDFGTDMDTGEGYAQKNDSLRELEREAYESGNMCFRDWEDENRQALQEAKQHFDRKNKKMSVKDKKMHNRRAHLKQIIREELMSSIKLQNKLTPLNEGGLFDWLRGGAPIEPPEDPVGPGTGAAESRAAVFKSADELRRDIQQAIIKRDRDKIVVAGSALRKGRKGNAEGYEDIFNDLIGGNLVEGDRLPQRDVAIYSMIHFGGRQNMTRIHDAPWEFILRVTDKDGKFMVQTPEEFRALERETKIDTRLIDKPGEEIRSVSSLVGMDDQHTAILDRISQRYTDFQTYLRNTSGPVAAKRMEKLGFEYDPDTGGVRQPYMEAGTDYHYFSNEARSRLLGYEEEKRDYIENTVKETPGTEEYDDALGKARRDFDTKFWTEFPKKDRKNILGSPVLEKGMFGYDVDDPYFFQSLSRAIFSNPFEKGKGLVDVLLGIKPRDLQIDEGANKLLKDRYDQLVKAGDIPNHRIYTFDDFRDDYSEIAQESMAPDNVNKRAGELYEIIQGGIEHYLAKTGRLPEFGEKGRPVSKFNRDTKKTDRYYVPEIDTGEGWTISRGTRFGELFIHPEYSHLVMPADLDQASLDLVYQKQDIFNDMRDAGQLNTSEGLQKFAARLEKANQLENPLLINKNIRRDVESAATKAIASQSETPDAVEVEDWWPHDTEVEAEPVPEYETPEAPRSGTGGPPVRFQESIFNEALLRKVVQEALKRKFGE